MLDLASWIPYFAIAAIAYVAFVFISESFNPFKFKKDQSRRRWKLARSIACIFFLVSTIALLVKPSLGLSGSSVTLAVVACCFFLSLYPIYKYLGLNKNPVTSSTKIIASDFAATTPPKAIETSTKPEKTQDPAIALSSAQDVGLVAQDLAANDQIETTSGYSSISVSEEHQLELEMTDSNHDKNFDDLEQTIAEADFIDTDLTISAVTEIAKPDRTPCSESIFTDDLENLTDMPTDFSDLNSVTRSPECQKSVDEQTDTSDPTETLLQMLDAQNEKIQSLAKNNQYLMDIRKSLTNEVSDLKFSLQKVQTIARKGIAQRDQALELKNNALTLAAMERKKRKLTEVKARKALMKMSNSLNELTDQSTS